MVYIISSWQFHFSVPSGTDLWKGVDINYFFAENPISKLLSFSTGCPYESDLPLYISGIWSIKLCVNVRRSKRKEIWVWSKGQLISKCLFGVIVWTKNQRKNYQNFCPIEAKTEILVIFSLVFCPNDDTKKTFWN